jgi:hypothetical protein
MTIEIGYTALTNPAPALKVTKVPSVPHGVYTTFPHTTQTQLLFYRGTAGTGLYVVLRSFGKIPEAKLLKVAKAVNTGLAG